MPRREAPHTYLDSPKALGRRLRRRREEVGFSQRELAFPGCKAVYICRIESGQRTPSLQVLEELARRLRVSRHWLGFGVEGPEDIYEQLLHHVTELHQAVEQAEEKLRNLRTEQLTVG